LNFERKKRDSMVKLEIKKLRGLKRGGERGRVSSCRDEENDIYIPLKYREVQKWKENFLTAKRLI
jgi:hypothetical protein